MLSLSLSLSLPNIPWTIQSKIIYIVCNYRKNQDGKEIKSRDVYHIAGVSKKWRDTTKVELTLNWKIRIDSIYLEEYRQHSSNCLNLLSGPNHNITACVNKIPSQETKEFIMAHYDWFKEHIINKMACFDQITNHLEFFDVFEGHYTPPLKKLVNFGKDLPPLGCLQKVKADLSENTCQEVCSALSRFHNLKSLDIIIKRNLDFDDICKMFSSIPRSLTKLIWRQFTSMVTFYSIRPEITSPYPFHLLPKNIRKLYFSSSNRKQSQTSTKEYLDYLLVNSVRSISLESSLTLQSIDFLTSPSCPVKDLNLILLEATSFSIKEKALIPPYLEVLRLDIRFSNAIYQLENMFLYSGDLPNLHTIKTNLFQNDHLLTFIETSKSLRVVDIKIVSLDQIERLFQVVAKSTSIEKVYFRESQNKNFERVSKIYSMFMVTGIIQILMSFKKNNNNTALCASHIGDSALILFNLNNNNNLQIDLSSYEMIDQF
ncbi:hypothetical protein DFA_07878 [Cavenderia fasciculata]|uniref:F-box domain-containing protein n=1 Tax=Cavenderia fasciculata TaxID=261658 RepID=F4Q3T1_CACFS|nr:uncharacterized protein DFA_07878 [Cavenderia fasciculata]EGG16897.1 hypothetical protein DFA_07878 [Cavenderia fasciculata]|eukprot:XP_004355371.1 hypothetical protein DFA_07878 [Cavenderia fasciculata]